MYLDPSPKPLSSHGHRPQSYSRNRDGMSSGFFSSQRHVVSPRNREHRATFKRKPLQETEPNRQSWLDIRDKTTVRLVNQTPSPSGTVRNLKDDDEIQNPSEPEKEIQETSADLQKHFGVSKPAEEQGSEAQSLDRSVSGVFRQDTTANQLTANEQSEGSALHSTTPIHAEYATHAGYPAGPRSEWQRWRSWNRLSSTGDLSTSSTLFKEGDSVFSGSERTSGRQSEFSDLSTLRGTTPNEEYQAGIKSEDWAPEVRQPSVSVLDSVLEASPERSTVRVVPHSQGSESSGLAIHSEPSQTSVIIRPQASPRSPSDSDQTSPLPRRNSRRSSSTSSLPAPLNIPQASASPVPRNQRSQESIAASEVSIPQASSPNFVAYGSDSPRPRSGSLPLAHSFSIESIQSRLQYPAVARPETGHSHAASSSWSSPVSSTDTLAPLQVSKKRLRHKTGHISLNQAASAPSASTMADEEIDTLPYPREQFTSHLSTIASESDRHSVDTSTRLSHFSLGSGVLTGDDASSILPFSSPNGRRRQSAPIESMVSEVSPEPEREPAGASSEEEPGDMTLGVYREESAKPQPLFQPQSRSQSTPVVEKKYDGPLPPLPPIPGDSSEDVDKVSRLPTPSLRQKRSGYSLRRRSNSTPSRRISESDRWSHASSIFPLWAKNFYGHGATLMSASKVSLSNPESRGRSQGHGHERNASQWTERSITSRLGTGYSEIEPESPASSHFLPSIFRPRTRGRANTEGGSRRLQKNKSKSKRSRPSGDETRPDSMAIFNDPLPEGGNQTSETLPSGQPKWGVLKDGSGRQRPLPRKYSKQHKWNEMEFPRPMTKDRLSDFHIQNPHLTPTQRNSRMSMWRAPSFAESLDTLWRSRCNRQILLFALGFLFPPFWLLGAILPIPKRPMTAAEYDAEKAKFGEGQSEEDIQAAMMKHEAGDAERRWRDERAWQKGRWWRWLNRIMSVIGVLVIAAVVSDFIDEE